jgi:ABC-type nitrate/sulfonate/bicarbonate transport system substrate-binding protein
VSPITLGFKAFDAHELLCHFVAVSAGLYQREKLRIDLADITFIADTDLPVHFFQASCGAALARALKGLGQRIVFVAVDRPMFWIYSRAALEDLSSLAGCKISTFPAMAPPHHLANIILQKAGLNVKQDLTLLPARDDLARLGLLKSGSVDAAVISSAVAPARMAQYGFNRLCCFGDEIRIPTTGLAVDQAYVEQQPELVQTLVTIHKQSLRLIHADPHLTGAVLRDYFEVEASLCEETARLYAAAYTLDGLTSQSIAQGAIASLCDSLGLSNRPAWNQVYVFA